MRIFLTFVLALMLFPSCKPNLSPPTNQEISIKNDFKNVIPLCEIIRNSNGYNGTVVLTEGIFVIQRETSILYDINCLNGENLAWFEVKNEDENKNLLELDTD